MKVSVIIPTLNAERYIEELLLSLKNQTLSPAEILVIDSSSDDRTTAIATELGCKVLVVERSAFDHGGTRNLAAGASSGEVLIFMTQDALPTNKHFLQNLTTPLQANPEIAASFGRQVAKANALPPEQFARLFNYPDAPMIKGREDLPNLGIKTFFFSNVCSAIKRKEFEVVGKFPEQILTNEDMVIAAKFILNNYKIAYVPEAAVWHSHNYSVTQYFRRYFDIGAFLKANEWVRDYARAEGEGLKFVKGQFEYLFRNKQYRWVPYSVALVAAKYAGYKLGSLEDKLPMGLKRSFSLQKNFWR